jgi:hypothetical protein
MPSFSTRATSSGQKSATAQVITGEGMLVGVDLMPPATGTATLYLYDTATSTASPATCVGQYAVQSTSNGISSHFSVTVAFNQGIYAVLTGTTTYSIYYMVG